MNILDIAIAKKLAGGGGGSGTDNYNDLSNLPKINDTTLSGNKSSSALGLQSEINSDSKLASDLVDDTNQDNKFVTSTEKNTWNAKQNAIDADHKLSSDLVDDANKTNKFVTSTEKNTWNAKQNAIDSDHKLSSSLVSFSAAEAAALASGIDSSKVGQISTNQTNILYVAETGVKNRIILNDTFSIAPPETTGLTVTNNGDGTITVSGTPTSTNADAYVYITIGEFYYSADKYRMENQYIGTNGYYFTADNHLNSNAGGEYTYTSAGSTPVVIRLQKNTTYPSQVVYPMIRPAFITDTTFQPGAKPNYDLTRLQAEDRAGLVECVDGGAKNLFEMNLSLLKVINGGTWNGNVGTYSTGTVTVNTDGTITINKTSTSDRLLFKLTSSNSNNGISGTKYAGYVLSGCPSGGSNETFELIGEECDPPWGNVAADYGNGDVIKATATPVYFYIVLKQSYTTPTGGLTFRPMICNAGQYAVSPTYQPYAKSNSELTSLEAEDRAALAEVVDSGAKNIIAPSEVTYPTKGMTLTYSSDGILVTGTATDGTTQNPYTYVHTGKITIKAGMTYAVCDSAYTGMNTAYFYVDSSTAFNIQSPGITNEVQYLVAQNSGTFNIYMRVPQNATVNKLYKPMICTKAAFGVSNKFVPFGNDPFYQVPINHNMIYRGRNLGATLTDAQHTALSSGNFTDLYLGDYWTKTVTIPAGTYTGGDGEEVTIPAQTNITLKAVIADFDTFYGGYDSSYAIINAHHAAIIVTGFSNVVWNKTNSTAGGYVASLIHKWLVGSALPQIETWFGSAKVLSHQKLLTNAITGDAASGWAWSSQKISLLSENQMYGSKIWGNSKSANGGYEPGEAFKHLNIFNHIDTTLLFGNKDIWLRDVASAGGVAGLGKRGYACNHDTSSTWPVPAVLILLS